MAQGAVSLISDLFFALLLFVAILLSGILSASETALFSLSPLTLRSYHNAADRRKNLISSMMERPREVLVTLLSLYVLMNILVQNSAASLFGRFPNWTWNVGFPLILTLLFGELLPKSLAMLNNTAIALRFSPMIAFFMKLLRPIRHRLDRWATLVSRALFFFVREPPEISLRELRHVIRSSQQEGALMKQESELLQGAINLREGSVKEFMHPREEVLFYDIRDPLVQLEGLFSQRQISYLPVCDGPLDHLLGILSATQFFKRRAEIRTSGDLLPFLEKPYYVPESMHGWDLLHTLRQKGEKLAIVIDEYGAFSGIIHQTDLIHVVIGKTLHERRHDETLFIRSGTDIVIASGKWEVKDFESLFQTMLTPRGQAITLGGWLIEQWSTIPVAGAKLVTEQFVFYVLAAEPNRIKRIYIRRIRGQKSKEKPQR